jgi:LPXTG-motif cell wall-anchored protein
MRKIFALLLAAVLLIGLLAGCGKETAAPETEPTEPAPTQPDGGTEEKPGNMGLIIGIIVAAVLVAGGAVLLVLKKKKK